MPRLSSLLLATLLVSGPAAAQDIPETAAPPGTSAAMRSSVPGATNTTRASAA